MQIRIQTFPRLGDVTAVKSRKQTISATLEVPTHFTKKDWQVSLWHCIDGGEWQDKVLVPLAREDIPIDLKLSSLSRLHFQAEVIFNDSIQFTIRFRDSSDQPWLWTKEEHGLEDGYIVSQSASTTSPELRDLIPDLSAEWKISTLRSQAPDTRLWSLTTNISPSSADKSSFRDVEIGRPFTDFQKYAHVDQIIVSILILLLTSRADGLHWSGLESLG